VLAGLLTLLAGAALPGTGSAGRAAEPAAPPPPDQDALYRDWGGGLGVSDYDPAPTREQLAAAAQAGFKTLKLSPGWAAHTAAAAPYTIDPKFLRSKMDLLAQAQAQHLHVILLLAPDSALAKDPNQEERYLAMCRQVAEACRDQPPTLALELLCEPVGRLDANGWNRLLSVVLPDIRKAQPTRLILVGASKFYDHLMKLELPQDGGYLVVNFYYWLIGKDPWEGSAAQKKAIADQFARLADWAHAHKHPLFLSAFGKNIGPGDPDSHPRWMGCVARAADDLHIPWVYSRFFGGDYAAYDVKAGQWGASVLGALMPSARPATTSSPASAPAPARQAGQG
jgi:endoglucanase